MSYEEHTPPTGSTTPLPQRVNGEAVSTPSTHPTASDAAGTDTWMKQMSNKKPWRQLNYPSIMYANWTRDQFAYYLQFCEDKQKQCRDCNGAGETEVKNPFREGTMMSGCQTCERRDHVIITYITNWFPHASHRYFGAKLPLQVSNDPNHLLPVAAQERIYKLINENQERSYFLTGQSGAGKTYIAHALFCNACARAANHRMGLQIRKPGWLSGRFPVIKISARKYVEQFHDYSTSRNVRNSSPVPIISPDLVKQIKRNGEQPYLVMDEIDKVQQTDERLGYIHDLLNAFYEERGTVVLAGNFSPKELADRFGVEFVRRILEDCIVIDFAMEAKK